MEFKGVLAGKINRKFALIFGIILFMVLLIAILIILLQSQILKQQFFNAITETEEDFLDIQEESTRTLSAVLEVILQDESLKKVYLEKDRENLFNYGQPLFQDLKEKYSITHFYFILPDGTNFVRIHNKEKYGDQINRATFLKARETKNVGAGIELGKTAYALRVVMPYYDEGKLIGYVELGQEIDNFLEILKKEKPNEFSLVIDKSSLVKEDWLSVLDVHGLRDNWEDLEEHLVVESTTENIFPCFSSENVELLERETLLLGESTIENKVFACGGFALIDASGKKSGAIFSLIDVTETRNSMYKARYVFLIILLIIFIIFTGLGFYVNRKITKPLDELSFANRELQKKNFKVRVKVKTKDEIGELGESFNQTANVLEKMDQEYKQLEKAKTEFLSITSHELRSPMTPMQAQLQMLLGEYYGKLSEKQKNALNIVARNTKRLDNIIVDFLEISRIEAARLKFKFVKKSPTEAVKRIIEEMKGFMPEKKIKINTNIGNLPIIEHDPDRLEQVLRNFVNNAIKFSKPGTTIDVAAKLDKGMILFSVKDQGIGINVNDQKRIFEPFFQAEQTMYREHQGTGLGLAIIRGIVESQNGKVWLESDAGKGTTFYFTLPLKPVTIIKPIKLLFSSSKDINEKIKLLLVESLGPMGIQEFEELSNKNQLNKKDLLWYIDLLMKKKILDEEKAEFFKVKLLEIFGEASSIKEKSKIKEVEEKEEK